MKHSALEMQRVTKSYGSGATEMTALDAVSLQLPKGGFTAIMGPSGSGKSTLLRCVSGLETVNSGVVAINNQSIGGWRNTRLTKFRRTHLGMVFQDYLLIPYLTAEENVALPLRLNRLRVDYAAVGKMLDLVGLSNEAASYPMHLSGGQKQRVAIARALISNPAVVLADEPTGALDTGSAREVLSILRQAVDEAGQTVVMVTHDPAAAAWADEVIYLVDGRIAGEMTSPNAELVAQQLTQLDHFERTGDQR